ncbi:Gustatory receptor PhGr2 [Pediculus humanus corporis]|uniref:Gustatory receptor n=1 Tax=Pediculus humanus subsp. corporis TaxID=121224 RepID=E0VAG6_PEDHC|nr:Gustatory receptor PhGr2 [Pediculus humanus corporis]EEB10372.1 Gustatory receptor PhGr2 [Pediculus humanus corporis]
MAENIYHTVKLFLYYSQIFGLNPVVLRKKNSENYFQIFWIGIFYSLSLAAFLCFSFQFSIGNINMFADNDSDIIKVSERSLSIYEFISFFVSWCLFDIVSWTFILVVFSFLYLVYKKFFQINQKLVKVLSDYDKTDPEHLDFTEKIFFVTHRIIEGERVPTPHPTNNADMRKYVIKKVKQIRHLHILLVKISQDLNRIFSTRILTIVSLNVILLCFSSFLLILMLVLGRRDSVLGTAVIWVSVRFFPTCVLIAPFCLVSNEADRTSALVHLYMSKVEDVDLLEQLKIFSMQLNNRKLTFTTHGFFDLDGKTILSVIGASFAYLVVLLQFHMTMNTLKQSKDNTTSNYKDTMA